MELGQGSLLVPITLSKVYRSINQSLLCGNSQNIEFLNKGQGFIVIESDPGAINKDVSEI